jgi:anti-sigma B factor antagonist
MPVVELTTSARNGYTVVALCGELDVTGVADAEAAIAALAERGQYLVLDMSALDFLDCSSLGALRRVQGVARHGGGDVVLAAPHGLVLRLLTLTGSGEVFWVYTNVTAAGASIARQRRWHPWLRLAARTARSGRAAASRTGTG